MGQARHLYEVKGYFRLPDSALKLSSDSTLKPTCLPSGSPQGAEVRGEAHHRPRPTDGPTRLWRTSKLSSSYSRYPHNPFHWRPGLITLQTLPTYDWLASQGITPSTGQTYTLSTLTNALKTASGVGFVLLNGNLKAERPFRASRLPSIAPAAH